MNEDLPTEVKIGRKVGLSRRVRFIRNFAVVLLASVTIMLSSIAYSGINKGQKKEFEAEVGRKDLDDKLVLLLVVFEYT